MSTTWDDQLTPASSAMDDDVSTVCRTGVGSNQWLSIQNFLMDPTAGIGYVSIHVGSAEPSLLMPFEVWVGPAPGAMGEPLATKCAGPVHVAGSGPYLINCHGATSLAQFGPPYVTLHLPGPDRVLSIGEMYAYARVTTPAAPMPPLSPPPSIRSPYTPGTVRTMSHMLSSSGPEKMWRSRKGKNEGGKCVTKHWANIHIINGAAHIFVTDQNRFF